MLIRRFDAISRLIGRPLFLGLVKSDVSYTQSFHLRQSIHQSHPRLLSFHHPRQISCSSCSYSTVAVNPAGPHKYFRQNEENKNAENYLRSDPKYKDMFYTHRPKEQITDPVVRDFIQAAINGNTTVVSTENKDVVDNLLSCLSMLSDEELFLVLFHLRDFVPCDSAVNPSYVQLWSGIDRECVKRMKGWGMDTMFQVADLWYGIKLVRFVEFYRKLISLCLRKCERLTKERFVRFMYCLNLVRSLPDKMIKFEIELYLRDKVEELNHFEVAVIALACFKTQTTIQEPLILEKLLRTAMKEREKLDSISVSAVAKFARFCSPRRLNNLLLQVQEAFLPELERLSVPACTHLALIGTSTLAGHTQLLNAVVDKVEQKVKEARLKELERIALAMTMFNVDCDSLANKIVDELRAPERQKEIREYGRCLPAILHYLSMRSLLPHDLIDKVLSKEFQETYYGGNTSLIYKRELFCLDFCMELEMGNYKGSRLDSETRDKILKSHVKRVSSANQRLSSYDMTLNKVRQCLDSSVQNQQCYTIVDILPHHHCQKIILCKDKQMNPVDVPPSFHNQLGHHIKYIPDDSKDSVVYHVFFLCNQNDCIPGQNKLTGTGDLIVRQLTRMGYRVHVVYPPFTKECIQDVLQQVLLT